MVGIITGKGPGIENSSLALLGSSGQLGSAPVGRADENVFVNAATGNLVITDSDEMLVGRGADAIIARTYNSLGAWEGDGAADGWRTGLYRKLTNLPGTYGTGTITRVDWDGSEAVYTWDATRNAYFTTDGAGAYDKISQVAGVWTWTDGDTQVRESYDAAGLIATRYDDDNNVVTYTFASGVLTRVQTSNGEYSDFLYTSGLLTSIETHSSYPTATITRTRYTYSGGRLASVKTDLTPADGSIADAATYTVSYTYNAAGRIETIESDSTWIEVTYDASGRVTQLKQAESGTGGTIVYRSTFFNYDTPGTTKVTDPAGQVTALSYDANGNLTRIEAPAAGAGQPVQVTTFTYDAATGDVTSVTRGGNTTSFTYDRGNRILDRDAAGNIVERVYNAANQLLAETRYLDPDTDGAGPDVHGTPLLTRYVYDSENHLRYVVTPELGVTEYRYDGFGQQVSRIDYVSKPGSALLTGAATDAGNATNLGLLDTWVSVTADRSAAQRTDTWYDFRGNVSRTASYATLDGFGRGGESPLVVGAGTNTTVQQQDDGLYRIAKTDGSIGWNADAHSTVRADGDFVLQLRPGQNNLAVVGGLSTSPALNANEGNVAYGIYFKTSGNAIVTQSGSEISGSATSYAANTNFWITRVGSTITYWKGATLATATQMGVSASFSGRLYFDSSIYSAAATMDVGFTPLNITNGANTAVTLGADGLYHVVKTDSWGWTADARGSEAAVGDFVLQVRPSQADKAFYAGVSANPASSSDAANLDYGFRFNYDGEVRRRDNGTLGNGTVTYVAGDSFWLVRTGSTLSYYKGATLEEAMRTPPLVTDLGVVGTLYFDSSINSPAGAFDVRFTPRPTIANGASTAVTATADGMYHVVKTGTGSSWGADARGSEAAVGDFVLRLRPSQSNLIFMAGMSRNPTASSSNTNVDYGIRFNNGAVTRGDGGGDAAFNAVVNYVAGDNFWIVRTGTTLTYYKGATLATATQVGDPLNNVTGTLYFDSSLYSPNAAFDARLDVSASAIAEVTTTSYVYDPAGRLLSRAVTGKGAETFVYDGMGRIISSKDFNGAATGVTFSSVSNTTLTTVTLANGLARTSTYNGAGQLISVTESGTGISATTTYSYDTLGRLRMVTDPTGRRSHQFYDALGRKIGEVDADGSAVEYRYDSSDNLTSTTRYVTQVASTLLVDGSGNAKNVTFDAVRPVANANDRWTWRVYDRANRLVQTIETVNDAADLVLGVQGAVTTYEYDGASRLIGTRRYDDLLTATQVTALKTAATDRWGNTENGTAWHHGGSTVAVATPTDYGTTIVGGKIDGATPYRFTLQTGGNVSAIQPVNGGIPVKQGDTVTLTFWIMAGNEHTTTIESIALRGQYSQWGNAGETKATVLSGPGTFQGSAGLLNLVGLDMEEPTLVSITRTFAQDENLYAQIYVASYAGGGALLGDSIILANPTLLITPAAPVAVPDDNDTNDRVTRNFYDGDGRLVAKLDAEGYLTEIEYDGAGRKVHTIGYAKKTDVESPTTATLAALRTSITTASGYDANRNVNNYWIYDDRGMLRATIDGESALTRYDYDAAGYVARQTSGELLPLSSTPTMATLPLAVDANASIVSWTRNLYGDVLTETRSLTAAVTTTTSYSYDVMRRLVSTTTQPGGADQRIYISIYDQLGRLTGEIGGEGNAAIAAGATQAQALIDYGWTYNYDAAGRLISKIGPDASDLKTFYYYDADGALAYQVEAYDHLTVGEVTKYSYNAFGERTLVTAYATRISLNGLTGGSALTQVTNVLVADATRDTTTSVTFNTDGTVDTTTDPLTNVSSFTYNAFGELEKSTVALDDDGTSPNLARSIVTTRTYDRRGQLTQESVALPTATGGDLDTQYVYDAFGHATSVINAKGEETKSTYDEDGRLISVEDALHHITRYTYDARDNLVAVIDALGHVTRYVYDRGGRRIATIDAEGSVVGLTYDADGRVIATRAYAGLYPGTLPDPDTEPPLTDATVALPTPNDSADRVTRYAYGKDGQLRFTVEAIDTVNRVTEQEYDKAGNPVRTIVYGGTIAAPAGGYTVDAINTAVTSLLTHADTRIIRSVYDAGRLTYTIDAENRITAFTYDARGAVTKQVRLAKLYPFTGDPTDLSMDNWVAANTSTNDRTTRTIYDRKGQLSFSVDALGYVTRFEYDKAGNLKKRSVFTGQYLTIDDSSTVASVTTLTNAGASTAAVTSFKYDVAGRLIETADPEGGVTTLVLDDLGRIVTSTIAGSTTRYEYDAAGRTTKETRGYGTADASITGFTYTDANQLETRTEGQTGDVSTTRWRYDDAGRVEYEDREVDEAAGYDVTIAYTYNAFGDQVKVHDARGNDSFFYYDQLGRVKRAIDAERYVTDTSYTRGDQVYQVKRYGKAIATGVTVSVTAGPAPGSDAHDATTTFTYNKRDELTATIDAENNDEAYELNTFGERVGLRNKLGSGLAKTHADYAKYLTVYTYDKRGQLLTETLPITTRNSSNAPIAVVNSYRYDARGNLIKKVEAGIMDVNGDIITSSSGTEARTTNYTYDKNDRLKTTTGNAVSIVDNNLATLTNKVPTQTVFYDARGNAVEIVVGDQTIGTDDARTLAWYDSLNRKVAELSPVGTLTEWTYDDRGNVKTVKVYDNMFAMPGHVDSAVYTRPSTTGLNARTTTYDYDRLDRLWKTTTASLVTGEWDAVNSAYVVTTAAIVTTVDYDAAGNVVRQDDGRGNNVWSYYDKLGRKIAQVDRGNYLTTWAYDAEGNVLTETRFAGQIGFAVNANTPVTDPANNPAIVSLVEGAGISDHDRKTTFTYDLMGRRLSETRWKVASGTIDSAGNLVANTTATTNAAINYEYNGLGQVVEKTEANLDTTVYDYDAIGRLENETGQSFYDFENDLVTPYTDYVYDGLNNLKSTTVYGKVSADNRTTSYTYGAGGRLATMTDAAGFARTYAYDIAGRVVRESYTRERNGTPASVTESVVYRYDLAGRMTLQTNARYNGTSWVFTDAAGQYYDAIRMRYNAFGEIDRRGLTAGPGVDIGVGANPAWQESFDYDFGGRLWSSTSGDGVRRYYLYDEAGNQTLAFAPSSGTTALTFADATALTAQLTSAGGLKSTYTYAANAVTTLTAYDARGQAFKTIEPDRQLSAAPATDTATTQTITRSRAYNAFGEVSSETDGRANTTYFYYNTMGRLVEKRLPAASMTKENGDIVSVVTNELYTYDVSGRLIAVDDANRFIDTQGHLTTRKLLAGSGHGDGEAVVTKEFHAGGLGVFETLYDVFGDARILRNELYDPADPDSDDSVGADEHRDYDAMGRLLTLTHRGGLLTDEYRYDGLGQRLRHWNSFLTSSVVETTDYDAQGRVTSMVQLGGDATTYTYLWEQNLVTTGLGSFGGWKKITQNAANAANDDMIERTDYFGRLIDKVDFGGVTDGDDYAFTYDKAGHITQRTNNKGENLTYSWYNTGLIASLVSGYVGDTYYGQTVTSSYGYDAQGNRTVEKYEASGHNYNWYGGSAWSYTVSHQSTTATYDALNRVTKIEDTSGASGSAPIKVEYWYDAVGNIRRSKAEYRKLDEQGAVASGTTTQDYWYRYDAMNRFTLTQGSFSNGAITGGTAITYDKAGRRKTMTHYATDLTRMGWRLTPPGGNPRWYENHQGDSGIWELLAYTYSGDRRETYNYTADGHLESVYVNQTSASLNGWSATTYGAMDSSAGTERASYTTDAMGRVTHVSEVNLTDSYVRSTTYNNKSQVTSETVTTTHGTTADRPAETYEAATTYYYNAVSAGSGLWDGVTTGGVYMGGAVTATTTINKKNGNDADPAAKDTSMKYRFAWRDGLVQKKSTYDKDTSPSGTDADWVTDFYHDASGNIVSARIADGRPRSVSFITDGNGLILQRDEVDDYTTGDPRELHYYFNGLRIGDISNNGTSDIDYAQSIAEHTRAPGGTGAFRGGVDWTLSNQYKLQYADFDQSYDPINGLSYATTASRFTAQEGDTLSSIALQVWGDASLWYLIASANGLSGTEQIVSGMSLIIPNNSVNAHNNTETFKVYDPNRAMGDNSPTANARPPKNRGCGFFGQVIAAVIAKVVAMLVAAIPVVGPILAPFAENITRQGVLILTGDQEKFNWKSVGMVGIDMLVPNPGGLIGGALHNAGVQVVGRALGLQEGKFDWASVAVAGVSSMVTAAFGQNFLSNVAGTLAGAATRSIITGTSFGDNIIAVLPDLAALTVGEAYTSFVDGYRTPAFSDELDAKSALRQSKEVESIVAEMSKATIDISPIDYEEIMDHFADISESIEFGTDSDIEKYYNEDASFKGNPSGYLNIDLTGDKIMAVSVYTDPVTGKSYELLGRNVGLEYIERNYHTPDSNMINKDFAPLVPGFVLEAMGYDSKQIKHARVNSLEANLIDKLQYSTFGDERAELYGIRTIAREEATKFYPVLDSNKMPPEVAALIDSSWPVDQRAEARSIWQGNEGHRDAFRHTYASALMVKEFGVEYGTAVVLAHEAEPRNPSSREAMDLYNDFYGAALAAKYPNATRSELSGMIRQAISVGDLIVINKLGGISWSNQVKYGQHGYPQPKYVTGGPFTVNTRAKPGH